MRRIMGVLTVLFLLAGCSEAAREVAERSDDPVISSAATAADEGSARVAIEVGAGPEVPSISGEGVFDLADGDEGQLTLGMPNPEGGTDELELRVVDDVGYLSFPGPQETWLRLPEEALAEDAGGAPTEALATTNPVEMVRLLERASDFEEDGTTETRGTTATRYRGTLDIAELTEEDDTRMARQLRDAGLAEIPAEVAVDDDGRLRRVAFTLDLSRLAEAQGAPAGQTPPPITFVVELFDFGTEVDVEAPPRSLQVDENGDPLTGERS